MNYSVVPKSIQYCTIVRIEPYRDTIQLAATPDSLKLHQSRDLTTIIKNVDFVVRLTTEVIWFPLPIYNREPQERADTVHPTTMMEILIARDGGFQYADSNHWTLRNDPSAECVWALRLWNRYRSHGTYSHEDLGYPLPPPTRPVRMGEGSKRIKE